MLDDFEKANPSQNLCRKGNVLGEPMVIDVNDQACDNCGCELIFQETLVQSSGENPKKTYICAACISRWKAQEVNLFHTYQYYQSGARNLSPSTLTHV